MSVVLLGFLAAPWTATEASAGPVDITTFAGGEANVTLTFKEDGINATAGIEIPRGANITSARMDVEGLGGHEDDDRTLDFERWNTASPHRAWEGWVQGNHPPTYPFWDPYSPSGNDLVRTQYDSAGTSDDDHLATTTGTGTTGRHPFHLFRFAMPPGTDVAMDVMWEGFGQCTASPTVGGAAMYMWKNSTTSWVPVDTYAATNLGEERRLRKAWSGPHRDFIDVNRNVFVLVVGKPSELSGGTNPFVGDGEVHTDYVRLNVTMEGVWREAEDVNLTIAPSGELWSREGLFSGLVRLGAGSGLKEALQAAVDAEAVLPSNITVPIVVSFENVTAARVRLSNLSVVYEPVVNLAPTWGDLPDLTMYEDIDAPGLVDLGMYTDDDWSADILAYAVVNSSTTAIEALVESDHFLSFYVREADWNGRATFQVNATDPWGENTTSPTIVLDVIAVNDAPRSTSPGRMNGTQGVPFYLNMVAMDVDGDPINYSLDTSAFDIDPVTGVISFTPNNEQVGLHRVIITVSDDMGGQAQFWLELTIANVNDEPRIENPGEIHGMQGVYLAHTFEVDDPDIIHGDLLRWSLQGDPLILELLELNDVLGELVWRSPGNGNVGEHTLTMVVEDTDGATDSAEFLIVIANVNDPPVLSHVADIVTFEDGLLSHSIHVTDPDLAVDPGEELTWEVDPLLFQVAHDGSFTYVALHDHVGEHEMTVTVTDAYGASDTVSFLLTVMGINHPPNIRHIPDQEAVEDVEWSITIVLSDDDVGDTVQVGARGAPFHVPAEGGTIVWTPQERHGGEHLVTLTATDSRGGSSVLAFNLTVITVNDPPTVDIKTPREGQVVGGGKEVFLSSIGLDEEEDHITFTWLWRYNDTPDSRWEKITTGPSSHWVDPPSGKIRIRVEASDGEGVGFDEVVIEVEAAPEEGGASTVLWAGGIALAVALLVLFLVLTGRIGGRPEEPEPEEEDAWEAVDDVEAVAPLHR
ncbi:MAG: hypothetical protein JSW25_00235 [Thermoplasmata archaeon]|nr:MAG: hypothetical protein JSW25_00235 [Thermoplasmata archaeon]